MFCQNCGNKLNGNEDFCPNCGSDNLLSEKHGTCKCKLVNKNYKE